MPSIGAATWSVHNDSLFKHMGFASADLPQRCRSLCSLEWCCMKLIQLHALPMGTHMDLGSVHKCAEGTPSKRSPAQEGYLLKACADEVYMHSTGGHSMFTCADTCAASCSAKHQHPPRVCSSQHNGTHCGPSALLAVCTAWEALCNRLLCS